MMEIYIIIYKANLEIGDKYTFVSRYFNLSLSKRLYHFFNVEELEMEDLKEKDIMRLSLDNNFKIIDLYKYSMEEIKKYITLL